MKTKLLLQPLLFAIALVTSGLLNAQITYNTNAWDFELDSGVVYGGGTADIVTAWTQVNGFVQSSEQAYSGTYSLKADFTSSTTSGKFQTWRSTTGMEGDFAVASDESYTALIWVYFSQGTPSGTFRTTLQKNGETSRNATFDLSTVPLNTWTQLQAAFSGNPAVTTELWSSTQFPTVPSTGTIVYIDKLTIVPTSTLSSSKVSDIIQFSVFPNPSADVININAKETIESYKIMDLLGKTIVSKDYKDDAVINISSLSKGVYILQLSSEKGVASKKIVKE